MAADVTRALFDLVGAHAIFEGQPLERLTRDAQTLKQHMIVSLPAVEGYGAMMLGTEHPSPAVLIRPVNGGPIRWKAHLSCNDAQGVGRVGCRPPPRVSRFAASVVVAAGTLISG